MNKPTSKDDEDDGDESNENIYVTSFSTSGVKLSNKFAVVGPCILFARTVLSWNVASARDITPESLTLFSLLEPRLECLIIGIGDGSVKPPNTLELIAYCRRLGISVEILNTEEACATFNFLNGERRHVAAAILPPKSVSLFNPEYFFHEEFNNDDALEEALPMDPAHPKLLVDHDWREVVLTDNAMDKEMSKHHGKGPAQPVNKRDGAEIRHTEKLNREEIEAMEDRYTPDGEMVTTALDIAAKAAIEKEYEEYDKTGVLSHRLQTHLNLQDKPVGHVDDTSILSGWDGHEEYGEIKWKGIDKSRRMVKQFDKLYDVGQEDQSLDVEEEGRILAEKEKMTLMGEEEEDAGEGKTRLLEAKEERVKLLEEGKEASYGEESREEKTREK